MKTTNIVALHYGTDGVETVTDPKRAAALYSRQNTDLWGADVNDSTVGTKCSFHPGRDYRWGTAISGARAEWDRLKAAGIPLKSDLFRGDAGFDDLDLLWSIRDGQHAGSKSRGIDGHWLLDNAPSIYIAEETIRQTGEIVREEMVGLSARSLLPSVTFNTYLESYRYDRLAILQGGIAMPHALGSATERSVPQSAMFNRAPIYKDLKFFESGASWEFFELERFAEYRANGAPDLDIVNERLRIAREQQEQTYNNIALFGWPNLGMTGVLDSPDLTSQTSAAAQQLGFASDPIEDLALFVDPIKAMISASIKIEAPNTIALGTGAWLYINTTDYKTVGAGMNETLAEAIMRHVGPLGITDIMWVPEMDYRPDQATAWANLGFPTALAQRWAGGINQQNVMLIFRKSPETGRMVIGKPIAARPQETIEDRTTVRLIQSLGSFDVRRPSAFQIVTNIGPV